MAVRRVVVDHGQLAPVRRVRSGRRTFNQEQLPEIALRLSRVLRAGVPLESAIVEVDADMVHAHPNLYAAARHLSMGRPLGEVVSDWALHATGDPERLLIGVIEMGIGAGSDLALAFDAVGEAIRDDVDHDRRRRILLTQTQMSAAVLVCLPVLFAAVASFTRGFVYGDRLGLAFLIGGITFDVAGVIWIKRLLRRLS